MDDIATLFKRKQVSQGYIRGEHFVSLFKMSLTKFLTQKQRFSSLENNTGPTDGRTDRHDLL